MDKSTLSNYGWVVVVTLVLAVMLALATPFGEYVGKGAGEVLKSYTQAGNNAVNPDNIETQSKNWDEYLNKDNRITTETSDNVMISFMDNPEKLFGAWANDTTKIVFSKSYDPNLTIVNDPTQVTANSNNALDISETGNGGVVAYRTTEGSEKILHIAGKDSVIMANPDSTGVFAMLPYAKTINFNGCYNTINATNMMIMFANDADDGAGMSSWESIDVTSFNTSNVTNMMGMFTFAQNVKTLDLSTFDTSKVTDMSGMFTLCTSLESITFSENFKTLNVTTMNRMFSECESIKKINFSSFDTSNVTDFECFLHSCPKLTSIDISTFNTKNVETAEDMFARCTSLNTIITGPDWDMSNANTKNILNDCPAKLP
jgi:surface protein